MAAIISAVSPNAGPVTATFAPRLINRSTISEFPARAAVIKVVSPPGSAALGSAPAFSSMSTVSKSRFITASHRGVTPSRVDAFTSAPSWISFRTASRSPAWAASISVAPRKVNASRNPMAASLREDIRLSCAVAKLVHIRPEALRHVAPQVADRRAHRKLDVTRPLAGGAANQHDGQRIGSMAVRIRHACAIREQGMIQKRAVAIRDGAQLGQEAGVELRVIYVDLDHLRDLVGFVLMV